MQKLIVVLGPTSSGKSSLGIALAKKLNGEIISADSRQVYKGLDIGTGKVTKSEQKQVPHHLLDVASPKKQFSVAGYKRIAAKTITEIQKRGKVPILVGGTAFYIYALIDNLEIPEVKPNKKLRRQLEGKTPAQLFAMLKKLDPDRAKTIDPKNPARLVRAIEIVKTTGQPVPKAKKSPGYNALIMGINHPQEKLFKLIDRRLKLRLKQGLVKEIKRLLNQGLTHRRLEELGLEYRYVSKHLKGELDYDKMVSELKLAIHHFAKRQMTWFKRDGRIHWIKNASEAVKLAKNFLAK